MTHYKTEQPWLPLSESLLEWDEDFHELMLGDQLRMQCYRKAIMEAVKPGDVVLDLGTGTGILSLWALEAGARHVYGIDLDQQILDRAVVRMNDAGFGERFEPINQLSFDVQLPERVDVLISEIMGNMADNEDFQPILQDAIKRFLQPDGITVPLSVTSFLVPVCAPRAHQHILEDNVASFNAHYRGGKFKENPFNLYYDAIIPLSGYLSEPTMLRHFQGNWKQSPTYEIDLSFIIQNEGTLTGFKAYFRAALTENTILDISGDDIVQKQTSDSWKHAYLPIENAIPVKAPDQIHVRFSRRYCDTGAMFRQIYSWEGSVERDDKITGRFSQSMER